MAFADIPAASAQALVRVASGEYIEAFGCLDHAGTPAIYGKNPINPATTSSYNTRGGGEWDWAVA